MSCLAPEQIAAFVSGELDADELDAVTHHLDECRVCQEALEAQDDTRGLLAQMPADDVTLHLEHRAALAAETLARADFLPVRRGVSRSLVGGVLAAAAIVGLAVGARSLLRRDPVPEVAVSSPPVVDVPVSTVVEVTPPPSEEQPAVPRDVVEVTPVERVRDTDRPPAPKKDERTARTTASQRATFGAEGSGAGTNAQPVIATSEELEAPRPSESILAFREGWTALRAGDNTAAIAAFDRATDDVVAEDALYWAAVASERMGDEDGARTRYRQVISRFPQSTRAKDARAALDKLGE